MPSETFRNQDYRCSQNGSTLRNSAATVAWKQKAWTSQSSSARALGSLMCAGLLPIGSTECWGWMAS